MEAKLTSERGQLGCTGTGVVSEAEVVALVDLDGLKRVEEYIPREFERGKLGKLTGKGNNDGCVYSGCSKQIKLLEQRGNEPGGLIGAQGANRVRIKRDGEGCGSDGGSALADLMQDGLMAAMNAVEIADGKDGSIGKWRKRLKRADDLHGLDLDGDAQAVVGEADMARQLCFRLCVVEFVRDVREKGLARIDAVDPVEGLLDGVMAGMMLPAEGVDDEQVKVLEQGKAVLGNDIHVGEISGGTEAVSADREIAVLERNTLEAHAGDFG